MGGDFLFLKIRNLKSLPLTFFNVLPLLEILEKLYFWCILFSGVVKIVSLKFKIFSEHSLLLHRSFVWKVKMLLQFSSLHAQKLKQQNSFSYKCAIKLKLLSDILNVLLMYCSGRLDPVAAE